MSCWRAEKARQLIFYPALQKGCGFAAYSHFGRVLNPPLRLLGRFFLTVLQNLSIGFVGAASLGGPSSYATASEFRIHFVQRTRRGRRPRRPVPVNHRVVNQRWTGRPGGRPLRKRKNESLRNSMVRWAAVGGGPYGDYLSCFVSDCRGRRPRRPVPVNHRAVNQRWTGRPGGRPLRKRKNESLRNLMVRWAAVPGGPYGVVG